MTARPEPRTSTPIGRRAVLKAGMAASGVAALGPGFWARAYAQTAQPGESPYGPLQAADANGVMLPEGFTSRVVARSNTPVGTTPYVWHVFPDGAHCFPTDDGGWLLVSNSENPIPADQPVFNEQEIGGVGVIRFAADGSVVDAYRALDGTRSNCAGGPTPWGTWLSCEEFDLGPGDAGHVYEVDPLRTFADQGVRRLDGMGSFKHENAGVDPDRQQVYLSEDQDDGCFYRFTPDAWPDLSVGLLEVAVIADDSSVAWREVPDPAATEVETRYQVEGATPFQGGEGCWYDSGHIYLTTKIDDRVWVFDIEAQRISVLYDAKVYDEPVLSGVDHIIVSTHTGDILVAEDGGNMEVVGITPDGIVYPLARLSGPEHGLDNPLKGVEAIPEQIPAGDIPTRSEITGLAFTPDGSRLYFSSQRGAVFGITYEITGPFARDTGGAPPRREPIPQPAPPPPPTPPLPDTGGGAGLALGAAAAAAALALRRRGDRA
jgi:secreted PhoX family phosphatase